MGAAGGDGQPLHAVQGQLQPQVQPAEPGDHQVQQPVHGDHRVHVPEETAVCNLASIALPRFVRSTNKLEARRVKLVGSLDAPNRSRPRPL